MGVPAFTGICLITEDVSRLSKFYRDVLDVQSDGDDVHTELQIEGSHLAIYSKKAAIEDMGFVLDDVHGTGNVTLMFNVEDVDAEYERIRAV